MSHNCHAYSTVAYGNKRHMDDFRALGSGYQQENPHTETFPSGFLIATMTELSCGEYAVRCIGRRSRSPIKAFANQD